MYSTICEGTCYDQPIKQRKQEVSGEQIRLGIIIMDKWTEDITQIDNLIKRNKDHFLKTISTQIKFLHDIKYVHWDLLPKNILYKKENGHIKFSIIDFGSCTHEEEEPINDEYYDTYYYYRENYSSILASTDLNINKDNIRTLTNKYKGIVDYFVLYQYIKIFENNCIKKSKMRFIELLERDNHKGADIMKEHLYPFGYE